MAKFNIQNVAFRGVASCVPKHSQHVSELEIFKNDDVSKFITSTGISHRRIADSTTTTSDLCYYATEKLMEDLGWARESIDFLVFVTQTPDYILPATSCILQHRLGLSTDTYAIDISLGCSGWVYGLATISQMMSSSKLKRGLLLVGETATRSASISDKSTYPLFGDCGTATALEYDGNASPIAFLLHTNGAEYNSIIIPDGGFRNQFNENSLKYERIENGISRNATHVILNGIDIFSFGISSIPVHVNELLDYTELKRDEVNFFIFHQANLLLNETIRKKMKLTASQVPYSLNHFGNTSSASIPLTMTTQIREQLQTQKLKLVTSGFGVGLSWGSAFLETDKIICPELIEI